jgi:hypothetical protein
MWLWTLTRSSPRSLAAVRRRRTSSAVASASAWLGWAEVGALEEEALAVDRHDPPVEADLAQAGAHLEDVARRLVGRPVVAVETSTTHVVEGLVAEGVGPPQRGRVDGDGPLDAVLAGGDHVVELVLGAVGGVGGRGDGGAEPARGLGGGVDDGPEGEHGPVLVGVGAAHPGVADAERSGRLEAHRSPDASGVPVGVEPGGVLERAGEVALVGAVGLGRAGDLDGEEVLGAGLDLVGDLELVGEEVALGVAEVATVEPHVAQVEETVEHEPPPPLTLRRRIDVESAPVEQGAVAVGERGHRSPVAGDVDVVPLAVVVGGVGRAEAAASLRVGETGPPPAAQIHGIHVTTLPGDRPSSPSYAATRHETAPRPRAKLDPAR